MVIQSVQQAVSVKLAQRYNTIDWVIRSSVGGISTHFNVTRLRSESGTAKVFGSWMSVTAPLSGNTISGHNRTRQYGLGLIETVYDSNCFCYSKFA